jgi:hypothetical protein
VISYPRVRMVFMLIGIVATIQYTYVGIGHALTALQELLKWLGGLF